MRPASCRAMTEPTASALRAAAAPAPEYAPAQVTGPVVPGTVAMNRNTATATDASIRPTVRLNALLIGRNRRTRTKTTAEATSRPMSRSCGEARNSPSTRGSSLSDSVCASRRIWMCRTKDSVSRYAQVSAHQGSIGRARNADSSRTGTAVIATRASRPVISPRTPRVCEDRPSPRAGDRRTVRVIVAKPVPPLARSPRGVVHPGPIPERRSPSQGEGRRARAGGDADARGPPSPQVSAVSAAKCRLFGANRGPAPLARGLQKAADPADGKSCARTGPMAGESASVPVRALDLSFVGVRAPGRPCWPRPTPCRCWRTPWGPAVSWPRSPSGARRCSSSDWWCSSSSGPC